MEQLLKLATSVTTLIGVGSLIISVLVWRFLVPQASVQALRAEVKYRIEQDTLKDGELLKLREARKTDLARLARGEESLDRLRQEVETLLVWKYGAERYMRDCERKLRSQGIEMPNRTQYGINGHDDEE